MEIVVIIILSVVIAVLLGVFLRDRSRGRQALEEQGEALSKVVGEKLEDNVKIFGDLRERLGELTQVLTLYSINFLMAEQWMPWCGLDGIWSRLIQNFPWKILSVWSG
jgi:hypothetical protein